MGHLGPLQLHVLQDHVRTVLCSCQSHRRERSLHASGRTRTCCHTHTTRTRTECSCYSEIPVHSISRSRACARRSCSCGPAPPACSQLPPTVANTLATLLLEDVAPPCRYCVPYATNAQRAARQVRCLITQKCPNCGCVWETSTQAFSKSENESLTDQSDSSFEKRSGSVSITWSLHTM